MTTKLHVFIAADGSIEADSCSDVALERYNDNIGQYEPYQHLILELTLAPAPLAKVQIEIPPTKATVTYEVK